MKRLVYERPVLRRFRPVRDVTLLSECCSPFQQPVHPKRGHAVFGG